VLYSKLCLYHLLLITTLQNQVVTLAKICKWGKKCSLCKCVLCLQLIEQALVVEEQLRKSVCENPALSESSAASSASSRDKCVFNLLSSICHFVNFVFLCSLTRYMLHWSVM